MDYAPSGETIGEQRYTGHHSANWGPMVSEAVERMQVDIISD
jgi:hypothetical protein